MYKDCNFMVIGAGTMGHSIAQVFAVNGFKTTLVDPDFAQLEKAKETITSNLEYLYLAQEIDSDTMTFARQLITYTTGLESSASEVSFVVETVYEDPAIKQELYNKLDKLCAPTTIITSNTSALNIFEIANISYPERLVIAHWFNPPHLIPLVEIVRGPKTSEETIETVKSLLLQCGKTPVVINQYIPGFIVNRISATIAREAGYIISQGWATAQDIDSAIITTYGPRFGFEGPLELRDHLGWDISTKVSSYLFPYLCNNSEPFELAVHMCEKGWLGVKSGRGLKDYSQIDINQLQKTTNRKYFKNA